MNIQQTINTHTHKHKDLFMTEDDVFDLANDDNCEYLTDIANDA